MPIEVKGRETDNSNENLIQQQVGATQQNESKFIIVAQELDGKLDEYKLFTFSSEDFKKALNDKFGGNINQFNQNLVLFALTLAHMEKAAEKDEELKNSLHSLQAKMNAINENIGKIAKDLGYTVSQYSFDKLMDKDLEGVKEALTKDFGAGIKLETIFSADALNSLAELFAFTVNNYLGSVSSVFMLRENKQMGAEENADEEQRKEKEEQKKKEEHVQQILQPQQQKASDESKQNKGYHSALRGYGKSMAVLGGVLGVLGAAMFVGGFYYLPMAAFGLFGIGLAIIGFPLLFVGVVTWVAGLINEAIHNYHASQALKQEEKKKKKEEQKNSEENLQPIVENNEEQKKNRNEEKENKEEQKRSEEEDQSGIKIENF